MCVLALWTGLVLLLTGFRRISAVQRGRIRASAFRMGESAEVPPDVSLPNRNLMNLLEMPLLFYVVSVASYVTRNVDGGVLALTWIYVALRLGHSLVHLTVNRINARLATFALSNFTLMALWIRFLTRIV
jgi:hypothetical protein